MQVPPSQRNLSGGVLLQKGDLVAGKYRVERVIGSGGMGQVVAARHVELGNLFAIKVLRPTSDEQMMLRFMREAQAIARLMNEHVVRVHDVGQTDRGLAYIVMEHLDGQDLGALLAARGPLPVDEAVGAILEACEGLADAHAIGIVHRDLKPQNLFLARKSASGAAAVKVVDFGLAKGSSMMGGPLSARATATGEIVGTDGYMAPEQIGGEATPRSDVWSMGVCLYRLLTGHHPFAGKNEADLFASVLSADPRPLGYFRQDVPPPIEAVLFRCLRKIPEERYADARALHDALLAAYSTASVPPSSMPQSQNQTAATIARGVPRSANALVTQHELQREEEATIVTMPPETTVVAPLALPPPPVPSGPPPTTFATSEEGLALGTLDRRSRLMLLGSAIAFVAALGFLFVAILWRRSAQDAARERELETASDQRPAAFPPPPVLPPEVLSQVAVPSVPPPIPPPAPAAPVEVASHEPQAAMPAVEPVAAPPVPAPAPAPIPAPLAAAPAPEPAAPTPAPAAAPPPATKKAAAPPPPKKKTVYDTP